MEGTTPEAAFGRQQHGPQRRRDRLDTAQSASALGLARGAVLQAFAPQAGGAYEDGDSFEADCEAEREMEAEQKSGQPRRRQRMVAESADEDGAANEASGEGAPRRRRQRVAVGSEDDEPSAGEAEGREEQEDAEGGEAMGNGRPGRCEEGDDVDRSDGEGGADQGAQQAAQQAAPANEQQARQAQRQTKAQEASDLAAKFQEQQRGRVHAPAIAESGMLPWVGMSVEVAQLDEFKV